MVNYIKQNTTDNDDPAYVVACAVYPGGDVVESRQHSFADVVAPADDHHPAPATNHDQHTR